ncbi:MAG: hypothetical protein ACJAS4_002430 [Bacteriovoracaceae bacterium]|jgi:hypothetical protein
MSEQNKKEMTNEEIKAKTEKDQEESTKKDDANGSCCGSCS